MKILDREPRWFERGVKEAICIKVNNPTLNKDGGWYKLSGIYESILRSSVPNVMTWNWLTLTDERGRIVSKFWGMEIFCVKIKSIKLYIILKSSLLRLGYLEYIWPWPKQSTNLDFFAFPIAFTEGLRGKKAGSGVWRSPSIFFFSKCIIIHVHSQFHDFEVEHVVRPALVLSVSLQSIYKTFTSIGTFK